MVFASIVIPGSSASRANRFERKYKLGNSHEVIPLNYTIRQSSPI